MAQPIDLSKYRTASNSDGLTCFNVPVARDLRCDVLLIIRETAKGEGFQFDMVVVGDPKPNEEGVSERSCVEIFNFAEECRKVWDLSIVNLELRVPDAIAGETIERPFQERWDFGTGGDLLHEAAPDLAVAGDKLFTLVFERKGDGDLTSLASRLREILQGGPRHVLIQSDSLFLPWGMLYTHPVAGENLKPDGSNWKPEGFWGYQHVVWHNPKKHKADHRIEPGDNGVALSLNVNLEIATRLPDIKPIVDDHFLFIEGLGAHVRRTQRCEVQAAFQRDAEKLERILYFYCHGTGATDADRASLTDARLIFPDGVVSGSDFEAWSGASGLPTNPLMFINACQGGQMTTLFYKTFAVELLRQGAVGLVGAQVDIPALFAAEYARRVFRRLFAQGHEARLGLLLRDVNREFWNDHSNPLGLIYSLYRGVNCFINRPAMSV